MVAHTEEERRLKVFENRMLRRIFGPKREQVTGEWRRLHNDDLLTKYYSGDQISNTEVDRACSTYGGVMRCVQGFGGETPGKDTTWNTQP